MEKLSMRCCCFCFIFILSACLIPMGIEGPAFAENTGTLRVAWDPWPPYQFLDTDGRLTGLDIEIVSAITGNAGWELSYRELPWKRILFSTEIGDTDIAGGASKTQQRERFAYFSVPYRKEYVALYVRKEEAGKYAFTRLQDMVGESFLLGVASGVYYGEEFEQLVGHTDFREQVISVGDIKHSLGQLVGNRVNGVLIDPLVAEYILREEGLSDTVQQHPMPAILTGDVYFMFSRASTSMDMVSRFNKSLAELKAAGTIDEILSRYMQE